MSALQCPGKLELPRDQWVTCDGGLGHDGKHSGVSRDQRYWWTAQFARARSVTRLDQTEALRRRLGQSGSTT